MNSTAKIIIGILTIGLIVSVAINGYQYYQQFHRTQAEPLNEKPQSKKDELGKQVTRSQEIVQSLRLKKYIVENSFVSAADTTIVPDSTLLKQLDSTLQTIKRMINE